MQYDALHTSHISYTTYMCIGFCLMPLQLLKNFICPFMIFFQVKPCALLIVQCVTMVIVYWYTRVSYRGNFTNPWMFTICMDVYHLHRFTKLSLQEQHRCSATGNVIIYILRITTINSFLGMQLHRSFRYAAVLADWMYVWSP